MRYRKMHAAVACGIEMNAPGPVSCGVQGFGETVLVSEVRGLGGAGDSGDGFRGADSNMIVSRDEGLGMEEKFEDAGHNDRKNVVSVGEDSDMKEEFIESFVAKEDGSRETAVSGLSENQLEENATDWGMSSNEITGGFQFGLGVSRENKGDSNGLNLMVDLNWFSSGEKSGVKFSSDVDNVRETIGQKAGKEVKTVSVFGISDLVWGKVRSHPWWPGQIFDPSAASTKAKKYFKKGRFLIAYFGDQTFAWNEAMSIKPFAEHFSRMEKQSNSHDFCHAVDCALAEMSRRVEYGLACRCLPREVYDKISAQTMINAGIKDEMINIVGRDNKSSAALFKPVRLVEYVKGLAKSPLAESDRTEFIGKRACLLAFSRWRGYPVLPEFVVIDGLLKDDKGKNIELLSEGKAGAMDSVLPPTSGAGAGTSVAVGKGTCGGGFLLPNQKEKSLSDLMVDKHSFSSKKRKAQSSASDDSTMRGRKRWLKGSVSKSPLLKRLSEEGEKIRKMASQMNGSRTDSISEESNEFPGRINSVLKLKSLDEMMSHLYSVAQDPGNGYHAFTPIISFFSEFRDFCIPIQDPDGDNVKCLTFPVTGESLDSECMRDSYWTDRIIESIPEEETAMEDDVATETFASNGITGMRSDNKDNLPTALILNFTKADSIPSESKLNKIFDRFGPLHESETKVFKKTKRAKVVFKRRVDAEAAFSSAGKYSIFGPSLVSYRLNYESAKCADEASLCSRKRT